MCTRKWHSMRLVAIILALLGALALPVRGDSASDGPKVGQWKTWVLASGTDISVPAPPADTSDQTKTELAELRQLQQGGRVRCQPHQGCGSGRSRWNP